MDAVLLRDESEPLDPVRLERLAGLLRRAELVLDAYRAADPPCQGLPGSPGEEVAAFVGPDPASTGRPGSTAMAWIQMLVVGAAEACGSLGWLLADSERPTGIASAALARCVLEFSLRAWWLAAPRLTPFHRVQRFYADWYYTAREADKLARDSGQDGVLDGISAAPTTVEQRARELGLWPLPERPFSTVLVADLLGDTRFRPARKVVYRDLSAKVHGTSFGVMQGFEPTDERLGAYRWFVRRQDRLLLEGQCFRALMGFTAALRAIVQLNGWGRIRLDAYESAIDQMLP